MRKIRNYRWLILTFLLILVWREFPNVHAAPTLQMTPMSRPVNAGFLAAYSLSLSGGTPAASYRLTLTGLPNDANYSFSPNVIGPNGDSELIIQTSPPSSLYCGPRTYSFNVTATNTAVSSDYTSVIGSLSVNQNPGSALVVSVSTDKSTYVLGNTVAITINANRPAEGTLTVSPPSPWSPNVTKYQFKQAGTYTTNLELKSASPVGTWSISFQGDDYCGVPSQASTSFNVIPTTIITVTTAAITTTAYFSTTSQTITTTITSFSTLFVTETGAIATTSTMISSTTITTIPSTTTTALSTNTVHISKIEHPVLELVLAIILALCLGVLLRRVKPRRRRVCSKCGFSNPPNATSFCVKCGKPLKKRRSP